MSYDQLRAHAKAIKETAIDKEYDENQDLEDNRAVDTDKIQAKYDNIESLFEPWALLPDPAAYDKLITDLRYAMDDLSTGQETADPIDKKAFPGNPKLDRMTTTGGFLQRWHGDAAITFKANFADPFKTIATNQFILLATMKGALEAEQALWKGARDDIDKLAHATLDALGHTSLFSKNEWSLTLAVTSAVAAVGGVAATAATGGVTAPLVFSAVGALASMGGVGQPAVEVAHDEGKGGTAAKVINSMKQSMTTIAKHIDEVEAKIATAVQEIFEQANGHRDYFVTAQPKLAAMKDGDLTGSDGLGTAG